MKTGNVNLAMIGCGQIARAHLRAIAEIPHANLVATMDIVEEKARVAAEE